MIGKKAKVTKGLFKGFVGVVSNVFTHNNEEKYIIRIKRKENDGNTYDAIASVGPGEFTLI